MLKRRRLTALALLARRPWRSCRRSRSRARSSWNNPAAPVEEIRFAGLMARMVRLLR